MQTIYANSARFDATRGLTDEEIFKIAPSVFAVAPHDSRSEKFRAIPTIQVVHELRRHGYEVVGGKQSVTRVPGKADFTKHLLRIRKIDLDATFKVGDVVAEMYMKNANDGTAAWELMHGLYRGVCANSLHVLQEKIDSVKVRHTGSDVLGKVIEGTYRVLENAKLALEAPEAWSQIKLDRDEQRAFADAARVIRFGDHEGNVATAISGDQMLIARRADDTANDLWRTFNRVQENSIKGGLQAVSVNAETGRRRRMSTRTVKGIDQDIRLNRALWQLANSMAEMKGVKIAA